MAQILVVDDEKDIRHLIADILKDEGHESLQAKDSAEALQLLGTNVPDAVILDIWLQGSELDGLGILEIIKQKYPSLPVVIISGHGNIETAISAIRMGAYDYIEKPFKEDRLVMLLTRAIEAAKLRQENAQLKQKEEGNIELTGESSAVRLLHGAIDKVAPTHSRVMITGPAGVGKEVVARMIHAKSKRSDHPFVMVSGVSLQPNQVNELLLGSEGKDLLSTGPRRLGAFERAQGGTLFIDEVADIPMESQGRLLKILQESSIRFPSSDKPVKLDVRVMAASSRSLELSIKEGELREDLYYRLNVVPINVPSLAQRREDIVRLCEFYMDYTARLTGMPARKIADDAMAVLQSYPWPGNVRQLRNVMEWLLIMAPGKAEDPIMSTMLPPEMFDTSEVSQRPDVNADIMSKPLREARELFEKQYLAAQLQRFGGNISKTASFIGMERSALHRKLKLLGVTTDESEEV